MFKCNYCKKDYCSKKSLDIHQKRTKSCLALQGDNIIVVEFECDDCCKNFSSKKSLSNHLNICPKYIKKEHANQLAEKDLEHAKKLAEKDLEHAKKLAENRKYLEYKKQLFENEKDHEISRLSDLLKEVISKPTVINNTNQIKNENNSILNVINFLKDTNKPITNQLLEDSTKHLTLHHCLGGGIGLADYALKYPLSEAPIICTDSSRKNFKYLEQFNGKVLVNEDKELIQFNPRFFSTIKDRSTELLSAFIENNIDISDEEGITKAVEITNIIKDINNSSNGEKTHVSDDLVKRIASKTSLINAVKNYA